MCDMYTLRYYTYFKIQIVYIHNIYVHTPRYYNI